MIRRLTSGFRESRSENKRPQVDSETHQTLPKEVNECIYELYKPDGEPAVEILFFHGLQFGDSGDAYLSTWTTGDDSRQVWPSTWLPQEFPKAHIFSVSYDSSMRTTPEQGRLDLFSVAENLMHAICWANIGQGFLRPVLLVGHSFGGLVMKQLCVKAHHELSLDLSSETNQKIGKFLRNMRGLFFYGTPHRGINLPPLAGHFLNSPLLDYVKLLSTEATRLETIFNAVCKKYKIWHIASIGESEETSWGPFHLLVVPEASARYNTDFCTVPTDHISICKPAKQTSNSFQRLINFIPKVQGEARFENNQFLPKAAVGLSVGVGVVSKMLQDSARVGIHGMGGAGKTTLAMAVFNELGPTFEYSCFCPDVKLMKGTVGDVKEEVWKHVYCDGKKVAEKDDDWSKLRGKRLLLVLDDVARDIDLQVLLQVASVVAPESRFILTSRDKEILNDSGDIELYQVPFLSKKDAKLLFLSYAFPNQAGPPLALENHIDAVVIKCEGLPLTLEVLGKYLKGQQNGKVWEQSIQALQKAEAVSKLNDRLWEKLRLSYTGLGKKEQQMFLDATTFFCDERWTLRYAKAAWSVSYGNELLLWKSLVDTSLVYDTEDDHPIKVHEQLRSLGRKIASEDNTTDGKWRRVWEGLEGVKLLQLTDMSEYQEIHSLRLSGPEQDDFTHVPYQDVDPINIPSSSLRRFKRLQYLDVREEVSKMVSIDGVEGDEVFHTDLVLLRSPSLQFAQLHFDLALLPHLVILVLTNYRQQSLPNSLGQLAKLKILQIHALALKTIPDDIGHLSKLERLEFVDCESLSTLPESFGSLSALNHLIFNNCKNLLTLPKSFGSLSILNHLEFLACQKLHTLPESFGSLSALNHLEISYCESLHTLPKSFGSLSALSYLEFFMGNLHALPESFGSLSALKHFYIYGFLEFVSLPRSFGELSALNHFKIEDCPKFLALPESFGGLSALNYFEIENCPEFLVLPESFGGLSALDHFKIKNCPKFLALPESFGGLSALNYFEIENCPEFLVLPESFGGLSALDHFKIKNCPKFLALPESFGGLSALNHVVIRNCPELQTLPDSFGGLSAHLEYLELNGCRKLERLPDSFSDLKTLHHLCINLIALTSIPDYIKNLQSLQILELGSLPYLKGAPLWLGGTSLPPPVALFQKFFRGQDGHFSSKDLKEDSFVHLSSDWDAKYVGDWLYANAKDKAKALDYTGALASLGIVNDLYRRVGVDVFGLFIFLERGIIKRDMGDLQGALEELNLGLEEERGREWEPWQEKDRRLSSYGFLKHRGFVRSLLRDDEGARDDGEEALKCQPRRLSPLQLDDLPKASLDDQSLTYLNFKFPTYKEMEDQEKLMNLKMKSSFEKLRASDFGGALVDLNTVDDGLLWPAERGFFLRERGVLKRLTEDLGGALEDLNTAVEFNSKYNVDDDRAGWSIPGNMHYLLDEAKKEQTDARTVWRHRGYVKYLLGDIDGAQTDVQTAWKLEEEKSDEWSDTKELEESEKMNDFEDKKGRGLGIDPVNFSFPDPPVYHLGYRIGKSNPSIIIKI